jgi:hypothetical protein
MIGLNLELPIRLVSRFRSSQVLAPKPKATTRVKSDVPGSWRFMTIRNETSDFDLRHVGSEAPDAARHPAIRMDCGAALAHASAVPIVACMRRPNRVIEARGTCWPTKAIRFRRRAVATDGARIRAGKLGELPNYRASSKGDGLPIEPSDRQAAASGDHAVMRASGLRTSRWHRGPRCSRSSRR